MPRYAMWIIAIMGQPVDAWLVAFDVDGHNGQGDICISQHLADAMVFASVEDLLNFWRKQSTLMPIREDGKPNRPLTACTIEPRSIPDDAIMRRPS